MANGIDLQVVGTRLSIAAKCLLAGAALLLAAPPLAAQTMNRAQLMASLSPVQMQAVNSLLAVQRATLIRESKRADDSQLATLASAERQLAGARAERDAAIRDGGRKVEQAERALATARANFEQLTEQMAKATAIREVEITAYRDELLGLARNYTPEEVELRQRFADGDPVAMLLIDDLAAARIRAIESASKVQIAETYRETTRLYALALQRGDPGTTAEDLLRRWDQVAQYDPNDFVTQIERARLARTTGDSPRSLEAGQLALALAIEPSGRSTALDEIGHTAYVQGDLDAARQAFEAGLAIDRTLSAGAPGDTEIARNIALSLAQIANISMAQGDPEAALPALAESLVILGRLSAADPDNSQLTRELALVLGVRGDVAVLEDDFITAAQAYQQSLEKFRTLLAGLPTSKEYKQGVSVSLDRSATLAEWRQDLAAANAAYVESLAIARELSAADPTDVRLKLDLVSSLNHVGDVAGARGDLAVALRAYEESLAIARLLSSDDPTDALFKAAVSMTLERTAGVALSEGELAKAVSLFAESVAIAGALLTEDPSDTGHKLTVATIVDNLIEIGADAAQQGDQATAKAAYQASLAAVRSLPSADIEDAFVRYDIRARYEGQILFSLAEIAGSGVRWAEVVAQFQALDDEGVLPSDLNDEFETAIQRAAEEAALTSAQ